MNSGNGWQSGKWIEGVVADMPFYAALEFVFRQRWESLVDGMRSAVDAEPIDAEHVHHVRVASRRLLAALDLLAEFLPTLILDDLRKLMDRTRRACGKARNLDVRLAFLESLLPEVTAKQSTGAQLLLERTLRRRKEAQQNLRQKLPKLSHKLRIAGDELLRLMPVAIPVVPTQEPSFRHSGGRILLREMNQLWQWPPESVDNPANLHQLRIACKSFRYAVEVFAPVLHAALREEFYPQLQHMQDLLGEMHDDIEADYKLERDRRRWKHKRDKHGVVSLRDGDIDWRSLRRGIDAVRRAYADRADRAYAEFHDLWPAFAGESFRVPLEEFLNDVMERDGIASASHDQGVPQPDVVPASIPPSGEKS